MTVYAPRAERLNLSFPVTFSSSDGLRRGSCLNISASGMLVRFPDPPDLWITGQLSVQAGSKTVILSARVARLVDHEAGFTFLLQTEVDRQTARDLVAFAASKTHLTGRPF